MPKWIKDVELYLSEPEKAHLVCESEGESGVRDPSGREAHAAHGLRGRRTNARLAQNGGDVPQCRLPEATWSRLIPVVVPEPIGRVWMRSSSKPVDHRVPAGEP